MKKFLILSTLMFLSLFISCTRIDDPEKQTTPDSDDISISKDSVLVQIAANLSFTEEPLTKSNSYNDLYAVRVYQFNDNNGGISIECVAYGTFDDLSKAVIMMAKNRLYGIDVAYIPNAKNLIHLYDDGSYGLPFNSMWSKNGAVNELLYRNLGDQPVYGLSNGITQDKGISEGDVQHNTWSSVTRYQGYTFIDPSVSSTASIDLYYQMIGFRIEISDFSVGTVSIQSIFPHSYTASPKSDNTGLIDIVVNAECMPTCCFEGSFGEGESYYTIDNLQNRAKKYYESLTNMGTVQINYDDGKGSAVNLYLKSACFSYRPNTKYVLKFSLSDAIRNGGIVANVIESDPMQEEELPL